MKKILPILIILSANLYSQCLGDVNEDGIVNVVDIVQLVGFILGTSNPSDTQIASGDLNGDGVLNVLDVVALVNIILDS